MKKTSTARKTLLSIVLVLLLGAGYWFIIRPNLSKGGPDNLPTAEELRRIEAIEQSSSQIAPDAVPGAGVRPVGSLPKTPPEPVIESTSTASTTTPSPETE
jgi:hypothetical protein